ncbi:MAG TPA: glycosyltransferase [Alphaproteobacteria bacterium]
MAETGRVFIWVQHLLGIGHLMRAAHIARHLAAQGWQVEVASGGTALPELDLGRARLHQLPPLKAADAEFSGLVDGDGNPASDVFKASRRDLLLRLFAAAEPEILIVEHYPFGRRQFRFELDTLLAAAWQSSARPMIISSVRDILVERKPEREGEAVAAIARFDAVLVHGDPTLVPFDDSFDAAPRIKGKLVYTGYVGGQGPRPEAPLGDGDNEIVVSAGGGAVGDKIAETALSAAASLPHVRRWRILIGANAGPRLLRKLKARAPSWVIVEPARRDFRGLLARCAVSVSQAGYNTVVDILTAGARPLLVPFASARETEQTLRAERLAQRGLARVLPETALTPDRLAAFVAEALAMPRPLGKVKVDGEAETVRILARALAFRRGAPA